jgi:hypothetical protein
MTRKDTEKHLKSDSENVYLLTVSRKLFFFFYSKAVPLSRIVCRSHTYNACMTFFRKRSNPFDLHINVCVQVFPCLKFTINQSKRFLFL